jgi:DNA polymerase-1
MFFRAFYAIPPLSNSKGLPTNALYGFVGMCVRLLREAKPDYMAFCFDRPEPSFRSELYEDYKANRSEMPEDLEPQLPYIKKITDLLGVTALEMPGYEADDIIGTLAKKGEAEGLQVIIVSGDKDFAQLVGSRINMFDTMKNVTYDVDKVVEKWGVRPDQMIDYLAIVGDSSDNIPGVKGVGPKGAQKLLSEFKTLEGVYSHIEQIKSDSLKTKLKESKKSAELAKKLLTIVTDLKLPVEIKDLNLKPIDKDKITTLFEELEFTAVLKKLVGENVKASEPEAQVQVAVDLKRWDEETWSLDKLNEKLEPYSDVWLSENERGFLFGFDEKAIQVDAEKALIGEVLSKKMLKYHGFDVKKRWWTFSLSEGLTPAWDSMLAAYVLKAGNTEDIAEVCETYLNKKIPDLASPLDMLHILRELELELARILDTRSGRKVLTEIELPLVPVLYAMERRGICIDEEALKLEGESLAEDIFKLEKSIHEKAGESFNIASPKQLGAILFEKLKIPMGKKTKTGYSTSADVLEKLALQHPICQEIMDYRELTKLKSTYVDALPALLNPKDRRIHTHFNQAITATGRLSSTDPNLQNIPIRTERGRRVRRAFVAAPGHTFLSVDYSQIELRVLAEISGDIGLIDAFKKGLDIHAATAAEIFEVDVNEVNSDQRRMAKAVNFGIAYGQGVYGLSETLKITPAHAKEIIENYFKKFRGVKDYMLDTVEKAKQQGYVESLFGRRRYIDELKSKNTNVQKFGERAAINAPMQGTASDLVKIAMIRVHENISSPILLQVHDELLLECPDADIDKEAQQVKEIMETAAQFEVPLKVNVATGKNWETAHA